MKNGRIGRAIAVSVVVITLGMFAGGSAVRPSHQMSPSSVLAQLVKIEFRSMVSIALGLVIAPVPGATPKNPASGLTAWSLPSEPILPCNPDGPVPALESLSSIAEFSKTIQICGIG